MAAVLQPLSGVTWNTTVREILSTGKVLEMYVLNYFVEIKVAKVRIYMDSGKQLDWLVRGLEGKRFENQGQKV